MWEDVARCRLERMRERVPEVELLTRPDIVRVGETDGRLERCTRANLLAGRQLPQRSPGEQPGLDDLGTTVRGSVSGRVSSRPGSITTRAGQWKAPIRFFPAGRSTAVFPPIPASTCPTSVVGTATQEMPRMYVAAANPTTSVVQPPPSPTIVPSRPRRNERQSRSSTATDLAASPGGTS